VPLEPQNVSLAVMDSARTPLHATLQVERLSVGRRVARGLLRWATVSAVAAVVMVLPLLHACGALSLLVAAPVAGFLAFRTRVLLGAGFLVCPKCEAQVAVAAGVGGWPARFHCGQCGSTFLARPEA
jgi:hypothetical protein